MAITWHTETRKLKDLKDFSNNPRKICEKHGIINESIEFKYITRQGKPSYICRLCKNEQRRSKYVVKSYNTEMPDYLKKGGWKDIPGFEGKYAINESGIIISHPKKGHSNEFIIIKPRNHTAGYMRACLSKKYYLIHRLMATTFLKKESWHTQVNHIDGNKKNNKLYNLEWCDQSYNMKHSLKIGITTLEHMKYASRCRKPKLTIEQANEIRNLRRNGVLCKHISKRFNIGLNLITDILMNRKYANE